MASALYRLSTTTVNLEQGPGDVTRLSQTQAMHHKTHSPGMGENPTQRKLLILEPAYLISNAALPLTNFISLGKLLNFAVPQFFIYKTWIMIIPI